MLRPPEIASADQITGKDAFFLPFGEVDAWFERRSDILIVTFYNLATVGEHELPHPWFYGNVAKQGYSVLGLITKRRDWYRNEDTPRCLESLRSAGLFEGFRRVLFIGASMGGFAALTYSKLVPGSGVLAFSPQSSLAPDIVPFERRYSRAQKRFDWSGPDYCDAAEGLAEASDVTVVFDPFVPEDKAHAKRLVGPNVTHLHVDHMGHQAIRVLKHVGVLPSLFADVTEQRFDHKVFFKALRHRRQQVRWLREFFREGEERNHHRLISGVTKSFAPEDPRARRYLTRVGLRMDALLAAREDHVMIAQDPQPEPPFSGRIDSLAWAKIVPNLADTPPRSFGVLHQNGERCKLSRCWIGARLRSRFPTVPEDAEIRQIAGTHLFAGHYRGHFGHFLVEGLSRLWALDHIPLRPETLIYVAYGSAKRQRLDKFDSFFQLLGVDAPIRAYDEVVEVEHLYVPELAFGWGNRFGGSPAFRSFIRNRLSGVVAEEGTTGDLYVSRSKLWGLMGQIIGEEVLEENLARLGYEIFHPQEHSIEVQLAKYKAARRIVALDGSALHLVPFVLGEGARAAIIKRRSSANVEDYQEQFKTFCGVDLDIIDTLKNNWVIDEKRRVDFRAVGEIDFAATFSALADCGYVPSDFSPYLPSEHELVAFRERAMQQRNGKLLSVGVGAR